MLFLGLYQIRHLFPLVDESTIHYELSYTRAIVAEKETRGQEGQEGQEEIVFLHVYKVNLPEEYGRVSLEVWFRFQSDHHLVKCLVSNKRLVGAVLIQQQESRSSNDVGEKIGCEVERMGVIEEYGEVFENLILNKIKLQQGESKEGEEEGESSYINTLLHPYIEIDDYFD